jgi:transcription elongation factor Elf1
MPYNIKENCLAVACPKAAAMLSDKDKRLALEATTGSHRKATFVCPDCGQEFEAVIQNVVRSVKNGTKGCPVCEGLKVVPGINDLTTKCPKAAAMWSSKNKLSASEVTARSNKKAIFKCYVCKQEFEAQICHVARSVENDTIGCPICAGLKVVSSINDLASQCPEAAAMWSSKNKLSASEVAVKSNKKAFFKCRDCGQEFEAAIQNVVRSVGNGFTGCYDCKMRRKNAISKPECFLVRPMMAFAGENGIANPFADVRNILGENSLLGLDFVDHIQKLCGEYNGVAWHGDDEHVVRDRFKFEAAHKAGYTMIRIQEPGLEVLDPKYDIVMPEGFYRNGKYDAEIMEEVGRKVIHLLEEIYGRKASPEIWALNNFKEFEIWYDANKKELEANARKKGPKGKTAAKMAA